MKNFEKKFLSENECATYIYNRGGGCPVGVSRDPHILFYTYKIKSFPPVLPVPVRLFPGML